VVAVDQGNGAAVVCSPRDGHFAAHCLTIGNDRAGHVVPAEVVPVVVIEDGGAVVQTVEPDGFRLAIENFDSPPAFVRRIAGERHRQHEVGLVGAGIGRVLRRRRA
jgi:hypothetical protein